jgi:hypothetical protein
LDPDNEGNSKHQSKEIIVSNDEKPNNSPDALVGKILYLNAETPSGLPPKITAAEIREKLIRLDESDTAMYITGTPVYINDEEERVMAERVGQMRNQLTIGELLDSISEEHLGDRQATLNELMRIAEVAVELFLTVIAHRDVTAEVLQEARGQWGPLVEAALQMLGLDDMVI